MNKKYLLMAAAGVGLFLFMGRSQAGQNPSASPLAGLLGGGGSSGTQPANDGMMHILPMPYEETEQPIKTDGGTTAQPPPQTDFNWFDPGIMPYEIPDEPEAEAFDASLTAPAIDLSMQPYMQEF